MQTAVFGHPHNDFLVCDGSLDKLLGSIESKTILRMVLKGEMSGDMKPLPSAGYDKDLLYLPETLTLSEGLNDRPARMCHHVAQSGRHPDA